MAIRPLIVPVADSAPSEHGRSAPITLAAGTYDLTILRPTDTASPAFDFDPLPAPAPPIGHGLLVLLGTGGLLFGAKLFARSNRQRSYTPAGAAA